MVSGCLRCNMTLLGESSAYVFLVRYTLNEQVWVVRVKRVEDNGRDRLDVLNADSQGLSLTGAAWAHRITQEGVSEDFWSEAVHMFLVLFGGGQLARA